MTRDAQIWTSRVRSGQLPESVIATQASCTPAAGGWSVAVFSVGEVSAVWCRLSCGLCELTGRAAAQVAGQETSTVHAAHEAAVVQVAEAEAAAQAGALEEEKAGWLTGWLAG